MEVSIVQSVIPSFAIAFLGYVYSLKDRTLDMKSIANLIYYIFSPCLVFSSLAKRSFQFQEFLMLSVSVVILIFSMMLIAWIYKRAAGITTNGFYLPVIFMNTGNIALPMALLLYGNEGLSKAIIFHLVNVVFLYSMGVFLVSKRTDLKEFFKIPFLYAAVFGVLVATLPIPVPEGIGPYLSQLGTGIDILGQGAIPLLIISLGYSLKRTRVTDLKHGVAGAGMRILIGPVIAFGLIALYRHLGLAPTEVGYDEVLFADVRTTEAIIILMASMPAPITSFLLNEKFNASPESSASMVLLGTIGGIFTIPLILSLSSRYVLGF
jgi:predicted permease